jgi:hypothetical protein
LYDQILLLGLSAKILDDDPLGGTYYQVIGDNPQIRDQISESISILFETNQYFIVRGAQMDVEKLSRAGASIKRLIEHPLVISGTDQMTVSVSEIAPESYVQSMIDQVEPDTAYQYVGDLSGEWEVTVRDAPYTISTRYSYASIPIKKATKFVYDHLSALDLITYYDHYTTLGPELRNVIAEQPGQGDTDCIVFLVGHLDSISNNRPAVYAPGADDNASGSVGVMIAADIMHQYNFACTVRYILFTGEEQGYYGSLAYVQDVYAAGENVVGLVNLDMIGYDSDSNPVAEVHTRPGNSQDLAIASLFADVVTAYDLNLTTQIVQDGLSWSDHSRFWDYGYPAVLGMEDKDGDFTPYYHRDTDRLSTLNIDYLAEFIKAAIGTVAHLAGPMPPTEVYLPVILTSGE